ncbi:MAG: SGNH/GDSL hydrolase family protein [Deltaproteobacteria bacterium]|nr:SGNH/GDSL hydrolase family protein [Deltaproteobacteria bacterium]
MRFLLPALTLLVLTGCDFASDIDDQAYADGGLLAIGDSIFDFHRGEGSIPEVVAEATDLALVDASMGGAMLTGDDESIADQRVDGSFEWLLMDGGGNDLNDRCACGACEGVMNEVLTADGRGGVIADIVEEATAQGSKVLFMGYPELPDGAEFGFDRCGDELTELNARLATLDAQQDAMWFVSAGDVVGADDLDLFDGDRVHPSPAGSQVMGDYVAETISANR